MFLGIHKVLNRFMMARLLVNVKGKNVMENNKTKHGIQGSRLIRSRYDYFLILSYLYFSSRNTQCWFCHGLIKTEITSISYHFEQLG